MSGDFDILHPGPWFGPKSTEPDRGAQSAPTANGTQLLDLCHELKSGNFSARAALESFISTCNEPLIKRQAIRLYCFVARHSDIAFIGRLAERLDHDEILTIVITAPDTLSPEIIPYLFTLLEIYKDTSIEKDILSSINMLFPFGYDGGDVSLPELAARFAGFAKSLEPGHHYFEGVPAYAGNLTKKLVEAAANSRHRNAKFPLTHVPTLLSVWSAEKCPIFYGQPVDDAGFKAILEYVNRIAALSWDRGAKYFYRHRIS
jgi:hypothetical protein